MKRAVFGTSVIVGTVAALLVLIHPWQIRRLDTPGLDATTVAGPAGPDASAYWKANLAKTASPLSAATDQPQLLEGTGQIVSIDRTSQVGLATIDASSSGASFKVVMQIGPVLRGTDLRDAFGMKFGDFNTQVDYAAMAETLNGKALQNLLAAKAIIAPGRTIRFTGAGMKQAGGVVAMVPMKVEAVP